MYKGIVNEPNYPSEMVWKYQWTFFLPNLTRFGCFHGDHLFCWNSSENDHRELSWTFQWPPWPVTDILFAVVLFYDTASLPDGKVPLHQYPYGGWFFLSFPLYCCCSSPDPTRKCFFLNLLSQACFQFCLSLCKSETHSRDHLKFLLRYVCIFPIIMFPVEEWWWR